MTIVVRFSKFKDQFVVVKRTITAFVFVSTSLSIVKCKLRDNKKTLDSKKYEFLSINIYMEPLLLR